LHGAAIDKYQYGQQRNRQRRGIDHPIHTQRAGQAQSSGVHHNHVARARGTILLLCNIAANNWASRHASLAHRDVEEVRAEVRNGLAPGVILVPSGVFALIRAQNAGCALMRGA